MTRPEPAWASNMAGEWFPVCPSCSKRYGDGQILDVKNYPDDGMGIVFLECVYCGVEAEIAFSWVRLQPPKFTVVRMEDEDE